MSRIGSNFHVPWGDNKVADEKTQQQGTAPSSDGIGLPPRTSKASGKMPRMSLGALKKNFSQGVADLKQEVKATMKEAKGAIPGDFKDFKKDLKAGVAILKQNAASAKQAAKELKHEAGEAASTLKENAAQLKQAAKALKHEAGEAASNLQEKAAPFAKAAGKMAHNAKEAIKEEATHIAAEVKEGISFVKKAAIDLKNDLKATLNEDTRPSQTSAPPPAPPKSSPERLAQLELLGLPDTLGEGYVADKMKTATGRRELQGEVYTANVNYAKAFGEASLGVDPNSEHGQKLDAACEALMAGLRETDAGLKAYTKMDVPVDVRNDAMQQLGIEGKMSLPYVEMNAKTPEGVAQMKDELNKFERDLKKAFMKGQLELNPNRRRQDGDIKMGQREEMTAAFETFSKAHATLQGMVVGLKDHLGKMDQ